MGGIVFICNSLNVIISRAKLQKIDVEMGQNRLYIKFFRHLLHFFKKKLCG